LPLPVVEAIWNYSLKLSSWGDPLYLCVLCHSARAWPHALQICNDMCKDNGWQ
jgi:hypothetical protein